MPSRLRNRLDATHLAAASGSNLNERAWIRTTKPVPLAPWVETLGGFALELGFDTFVFWPNDEPLDQLQRFAEEVVPALRC